MTVQIAVKLPDDLVEAIDELVRDGVYPSRSGAMRAGAEAIVAAREESDLERRFRDGFERLPETAAELAEAKRLAIESIREESWERWW